MPLLPGVMEKKHLFNILHHPVLGGCQNKFTIGSSPDPLSLHEGLASETITI